MNKIKLIVVIFLVGCVATIAAPTFAFSPNDPLFNQQWGLTKISATAAWDKTMGSNSVVVAVLDTGIDYNQEDLKNQMWRDPITGFFGYDFVNSDNDPIDDHKHGTMVSGIIAAQTNNNLGIAGICSNCKIMAVKVMNSDGEGTPENIAAGIRYAADHGAKVINMSFGLTVPIAIIDEAVSYAHLKNVTIVAATGNKGLPAVEWPAASPYVISVGGITSDDTLASFSNYGAGVDLVAPALKILTSSRSASNQTNLYEQASGTSFASAFVSGAAALLASADPSLSPDQIAKRIISSADKIAAMGSATQSIYYGSGRLNISKMLNFDTFIPNLSGQVNLQNNSYIFSGTVTDDNNSSDILPQVANSNIANFSYQLDSGAWQSILNAPTPSPYNFSAVLPISSIGQHTLTVRTQDTAGNTKSSSTTFNSTTTSNTTNTPPVTSSGPPSYHARFSNQSAYVTLNPGQKASLWLELQNTGASTWQQNTANLGTARPLDRNSKFYDSATWLSPNRIKSDSATIAPGAIGRFSFDIIAPTTPGTYKEYFRPVADGFGWLEDPGIYWQIIVTRPSYHTQFINQSDYVTLSPGQLANLWLDILNTGATTWDSNTVHLGTSRPLDRQSLFYSPALNDYGGLPPTSCSPTAFQNKTATGCVIPYLNWYSQNRINMTNSQVLPSGIAHFEFTIKAPSQKGTYYEYFRPVADGVGWLEDPGIFWKITVQ